MVKLYGTIQELSELDKSILDACVEKYGTKASRYTEVKEDKDGLFITLNPEDAIEPVTFLSEAQLKNLQTIESIEPVDERI